MGMARVLLLCAYQSGCVHVSMPYMGRALACNNLLQAVCSKILDVINCKDMATLSTTTQCRYLLPYHRSSLAKLQPTACKRSQP